MKQKINLNIVQPTIDEWSKLYEVAIEFKKLKPWELIQDNEIFAVMNPQTGEYAYCSVMGYTGHYYGITAYLGSEGLDGLMKVMTGEVEPDDPDFIFTQNCLTAFFEDREFLSVEDRKIIKQLELRFRGKNQWPVFRNYSPGYFPWFISSDECRFLTTVLNQAIYVYLRSKEEGNHFLQYVNIGKNENKSQFALFTRIPEKKDGGLKWKSIYIEPKDFNAEYSTFILSDELKVKRLQKLGKRRGAAWEVDTFYSPGPIQEEPNLRPYYPKICLVFDQGRGKILGFNIIKSIEEEGIKFIDLITELIEKYKQLPYKIIIQRDETKYLLINLCKQLGIAMEQVDYLINLEEARYEMHNFFSSMGDIDDEYDE